MALPEARASPGLGGTLKMSSRGDDALGELTPMRIALTGGAGAVGSAVIARLLERGVAELPIRSLDLAPTTHSALTGEPWPEGAVESLIGSTADFDAVSAAVAGVDAVIHLATGPPDWEGNLQGSIVGTYNVYEAARLSGARRIATASRAGVTGQPNDGEGSPYPDGLTKTTTMEYKPTDHYTVSKIFHEATGYMYAQQHGLGIVCCRIGNFSRDRDEPTHPHHLGWRDCGEVFVQAIVHPLAPVEHEGGKTTHDGKEVRFYKVFAVSDSNWPMYDLEWVGAGRPSSALAALAFSLPSLLAAPPEARRRGPGQEGDRVPPQPAERGGARGRRVGDGRGRRLLHAGAAGGHPAASAARGGGAAQALTPGRPS